MQGHEGNGGLISVQMYYVFAEGKDSVGVGKERNIKEHGLFVSPETCTGFGSMESHQGYATPSRALERGKFSSQLVPASPVLRPSLMGQLSAPLNLLGGKALLEFSQVLLQTHPETLL